eukprot:6290331-Amphidinium_carterae.1
MCAWSRAKSSYGPNAVYLYPLAALCAICETCSRRVKSELMFWVLEIVALGSARGCSLIDTFGKCPFAGYQLRGDVSHVAGAADLGKEARKCLVTLVKRQCTPTLPNEQDEESALNHQSVACEGVSKVRVHEETGGCEPAPHPTSAIRGWSVLCVTHYDWDLFRPHFCSSDAKAAGLNAIDDEFQKSRYDVAVWASPKYRISPLTHRHMSHYCSLNLALRSALCCLADEVVQDLTADEDWSVRQRGADEVVQT